MSYIDDLLTDLQTTQRKRPSTFNKVLGNLRGNYAGAVLTLNPGVAIAQAASCPQQRPYWAATPWRQWYPL